MGKIYYLMGKSSSGKDTIYKYLIGDEELKLKRIVGYTTRPIREGEEEGVEYHFVDETRMLELESEGKVIERRNYNTVYGIWSYFTADDKQIDLDTADYLLIGTLEAYAHIRDYYGEEKVVPLYIEVDDGIRLMRALNREMQQTNPKYSEMCRRYLADQEDFSEDRLAEAGIKKRYINDDIKVCLKEIKDIIKAKI